MSLQFDVAWWADFRAVMRGSLDNCTDNSIFRMTQVDRANWVSLLNNGQMPVPWQIVDVLGQTPQDWGLQNICFNTELIVYGIHRTTDSNAVVNAETTPMEYDIQQYCLNQASKLRDGLLAYTGTNFQIMDEFLPVTDSSSVLAPNKAFIAKGNQYWAWALHTQVFTGECLGT